MYLLPSYSRPELLKKCLDSLAVTASNANGLVMVDEKDPKREEYEKITLPVGWDLVWTKGVTMGEKVGEVWERLNDAEYVGIINDDFEFIQPEWDVKLLKYLDGKNFVSSNDRKVRSWVKPSGVTVWSMPLLKAIGWKSFFPPSLNHLFIDDCWLCIGNATGSWRMAADCVVLHKHALDGEMQPDATFHKTYDDFFSGKSRDQSVFELFMKHDFQNIVKKILEFQDYLPGEQQQPKVFGKNVSYYDKELKEG